MHSSSAVHKGLQEVAEYYARLSKATAHIVDTKSAPIMSTHGQEHFKSLQKLFDTK
jgi:hypothetical protein